MVARQEMNDEGAAEAMGSDTVRVAINAQLASFDDSYRNAGISRFISTLLEGLATLNSGQEYTAFMHPKEADQASDSPLARTAHLRLMGIALWGADGPVRRIAWEQFALPGVLRALDIDVFHAPANVLPARLPCPSVVTVHDLAFMRYPQFFRPSRRVYQRRFTARSVARATQVVAVSESAKRDLVDLMRVPGERIHVIYPGIAADFQPVGDPETLASFRAKHRLPERYLLYLGTLEPRKNLLTLVEAYARLAGQVRLVEQTIANIPVSRLRQDYGTIRRGLDSLPPGPLREERERAMRAVTDQLDVARRLGEARETLLARMESAVLGLEGLVARMAELLALHATTAGGSLTATRVAELTSDLEGMRAGLAEAERVSRTALAGGVDLPP